MRDSSPGLFLTPSNAIPGKLRKRAGHKIIQAGHAPVFGKLSTDEHGRDVHRRRVARTRVTGAKSSQQSARMALLWRQYSAPKVISILLPIARRAHIMYLRRERQKHRSHPYGHSRVACPSAGAPACATTSITEHQIRA